MNVIFVLSYVMCVVYSVLAHRASVNDSCDSASFYSLTLTLLLKCLLFLYLYELSRCDGFSTQYKICSPVQHYLPTGHDEVAWLIEKLRDELNTPDLNNSLKSDIETLISVLSCPVFSSLVTIQVCIGAYYFSFLPCELTILLALLVVWSLSSYPPAARHLPISLPEHFALIARG